MKKKEFLEFLNSRENTTGFLRAVEIREIKSLVGSDDLISSDAFTTWEKLCNAVYKLYKDKKIKKKRLVLVMEFIRDLNPYIRVEKYRYIPETGACYRYYGDGCYIFHSYCSETEYAEKYKGKSCGTY